MEQRHFYGKIFSIAIFFIVVFTFLVPLLVLSAAMTNDPGLPFIPFPGSTKIGNFCIIGGAANFAGHLTIADRTTVSGNTSIIRSIAEPGQHFTGVYPSMLHSAWEKNAAILRGLDKIRQRLRLLDKNKTTES